MTAPMMLSDLRARVDLGVAWLDQHHPGWWRTDRPRDGDGGPIDVDNLSMSNTCYCVLGQLLGSFYRATITLDEAVAYGFDAATPAMPEEGEWMAAMRDEFEALTELWSQVIERRRAGVSEP
ncbi:hypothetical protein FJK98_02325 [Micromonospora sp. HM134]|uniref:hypothetical protein n=1 Tax=Micromonospora sp. HM134 TaxID=2583243 RepID=UPI001198A283|nr:hypothetical protein [Micromonospora sp. HM134]QDY06141.1 hypothetical protein FJK98_02325 [Micromonospora sp. HM134]